MKLTKSQLRQIIKEELEVVLTNEEVGDFFGEDVQRKLEEEDEGEDFYGDSAAEEEGEAAEIAGATSGQPYKDVSGGLGESNAADAADELTGRIPDAELTQIIQSLEELLNDPELSQALSDDQRIELETIHNFILKGRMG